MPLNESTVEIDWPESHCVFVRKVGQFCETARACWGSFTAAEPAIAEVTDGFVSRFSMYKLKPEMVYCAGSSVVSAPMAPLPEGVEYFHFKGGKYLQFTLTGSYSQLPVACGQVFERVKNASIVTRDDFYIEHYANNPSTTTEEDLVTHILIPIY